MVIFWLRLCLNQNDLRATDVDAVLGARWTWGAAYEAHAIRTDEGILVTPRSCWSTHYSDQVVRGAEGVGYGAAAAVLEFTDK